MQKEHLNGEDTPPPKAPDDLLGKAPCLVANGGVDLARRHQDRLADTVLVDRLDGRVRVDAGALATVVLGADHHDGQLHGEGDPFLGVERQGGEGVDGGREVVGPGDLEVAAAVVGALAGLEHEGKGQAVVGILERSGQELAAFEGHLRRHGDFVGAEVLLLIKLVLDKPQRAPRRVDGHPSRLARGSAHAADGDVLEHVGVDVLDLDGQHVAPRRQLSDLGGVLEGPAHVPIAAVDLLGRAAVLV